MTNQIPEPPSETATTLPSARPGALPAVRPVHVSDLGACLASGWADFRSAPLKGLFFGAIYAAGGVFLVAAAARLNAGWAVYPAMLGFALIGPFIAVGLYEISRQRETGARASWGDVLGVIWRGRKTEIAWMGFVMLFLLVMWMYQIRILLALFLGMSPFHGFDGLVRVLFTTQAGLSFLAVGHLVGAALALVVFSITVVSIPLLLDRKIDIISAIITSVNAVRLSPGPMLGWGVCVTLVLFVSALPAFAGLLVSLPVLGHATWALYRRAVEPA